MKPSIITLTTDFGLSDSYVAAMKGVILSINPAAAIVDISHAVEPQNVFQGAFVFGSAYLYFPPDTVHVVVVDPGVGTRRRAIALRVKKMTFLAPDNGVLSYVINETAGKSHYGTESALFSSGRKINTRPRYSRGEPISDSGMRLPCHRLPCNDDETLNVKDVTLRKGIQAYALTNPAYWRLPVSSTFHGRDIFAPVAAHLSLGEPIRKMGEKIASVKAFSTSGAVIISGRELSGRIIYIDRFGNLITNISARQINSRAISIRVLGRTIKGLSPSYVEGGQLPAIIGSTGHLEIAKKNGSAAAFLGAGTGDEVKVDFL